MCCNLGSARLCLTIPRLMRFFLDSASVDDAKKVRDWGLLDGVWLSAAAAESAGLDYRRAARDLSGLTDGPVCVEPGSGDAAATETKQGAFTWWGTQSGPGLFSGAGKPLHQDGGSCQV